MQILWALDATGETRLRRRGVKLENLWKKAQITDFGKRDKGGEYTYTKACVIIIYCDKSSCFASFYA